MFKNLLNRNQLTPPEEDLDKKLQTEINELENKSFKLHSQIMASGDVLTEAKQALMNERADIVRQIGILKTKQEAPKEQKALEAINKLFKERRYILKINGKEVKPKKGLITLHFLPCKHKKIISQHELLTYQSTKFTTQAWLAKYQSMFNAKGVMTRSVNCVQCRKAHPSTLQGQAITIGRVSIELSTF